MSEAFVPSRAHPIPRYRAALFDLDGTLTDSGPGILSSLRSAFRAMGRPVPPEKVLRKFIGPPLIDSFMQYCGFTAPETAEAIRLYRLAYEEGGGMYRAEVYPGIPRLLESLRGAGMLLAVATAKPGRMAEPVLARFGLSARFDAVFAADGSERSQTKDALILPALEKLGCTPAQAVMVGDTKFDAIGARLAGTAFAGVLYGFGSEAEMRAEGARQFARSPEDLFSLLVDKG
jgi:phosphoglycolate phosphatase